MAAHTGMEFRPESKPFKKFMFDFADSATFGLIPNEFRPSSIGEDLHGESWGDRTAGSIGRLGGGFASGGLILKGGKMALGGIKGWASKGTTAEAASRSNQYTNMFAGSGNVNFGPNPGLLGMPNIATGFQKYNPFRSQTQYMQGAYPSGGGWSGPNNSFIMS